MFILYEARALHDHLRLTNNVFETEKESQYIYPKKEIKKKQQKDGNAKIKSPFWDKMYISRRFRWFLYFLHTKKCLPTYLPILKILET